MSLENQKSDLVNHFNNLPNEMIFYILQFLDKLDRTILLFVCRQFNIYTLNHFDIVSKKIICREFAALGKLSLLKWARDNSCPWDELTCSAATEYGNGHFEVLKWAHDNGCPWDENTCCGAAMGNHLEILKWAHESGCPWD